MAWAPARRRQLAASPLLCICGLLAIAYFFMLGIAVGTKCSPVWSQSNG
jgi:hypothetical protein